MQASHMRRYSRPTDTRVGLAHPSKLPKADDRHRSKIDAVQWEEGGDLSRRQLRHRGDPGGKTRWITLAAGMLAGAMVVIGAGTAAFFVATYILDLP